MRYITGLRRLTMLSMFSTCLFLLSPLMATPRTVDFSADSDPDISSIFAPGYILQDRNQDDVIDFVNAAIILPDSPAAAEVVCAANIAARLGHETSAMNLGLVEFYSDETESYEIPVIIVGRQVIQDNRIGGDIDELARQLRPGQGAISVIRPDDRFQKGGVLLIGYDDTGLISAADYFAGRYPAVWKMDGATYEDISEKFSDFLTQREIEPEEVFLHCIVVGADRRGVAKLAVRIRVADNETYEKALAAFEGTEEAGVEEASEEEAGEEDKQELELSDLEVSDLHRVEVHLADPDRSRLINLLPEKPWQTKAGSGWASTASPDFTLSQLYTIRGLFRDTNQDFVPDEVISYLSASGGEAPGGIVDIAARIGLESAGIRLPLVVVGGEEDYPEEYGFPIIYGVGHYQAERLQREGRLHGVIDRPGEGFIQFAAEAFGEKNGLVIGAADEAGLQAVSGYVAGRMPYLWEYGKGNYRLEDVETEVRRFFQAKKAAGQISLALDKLNTWLDRIGEKDIEWVDVEISAREEAEGLDAYIEKVISHHFPRSRPSATTYKTGFGVGKTIFEQEFDIPWEVDEFWSVFKEEALPHLTSGSRGRIVVRVSESPEVRARLRDEIQSELRRKGIGGDEFEIIVLSAYKQGYSWLYDEVLPRIRNKSVGEIEITYHTLKDSEEIRWQTINANTRWLQELYPIDAIVARELGIADSLITFTPTQVSDPIYTVKVSGGSGSVILEESFDPKYVVRPFFDLFPEYESVRVTTGWVLVEADGRTLIDRRIRTDPETFWDHLQTETYRKIIDYVMDVQEGRPSSANAPYFDEFRVELTLSEPNYRLGIDEEVISSVEALHEDIYFETLTLFNLIGGRYGAGSMNFPGRILPYIQPPIDGKPGRARIVFTGKERARPELIMTHKERDKEPVKQRYQLSDLGVDPPVLRGITVRAGAEGLSQLLFEVVATDSTDRYEEFKERSSEVAIDRSFLSARKLADMVTILGQLHEEGIFEDEMSFDRVEEMLFRITLEDSTEFSRFVSLPRSRHPKSTGNPALFDRSFRYSNQRMVQWNTPIGLSENKEILGRLNTFPGVNVYYMATSFLGHDIYAADFLPPVEAQFVSQAKLNALKPTLFLSGRMHANEVSSTSHLLRLGELLVTDPIYKDYLNKVNVVLQPITNPDGVSVAYEMQKVNPDFMLHAGYLGALGVNVSSESGSPDPRYPEAKVRPRLRETWLPDIYIDMHGYPSHEWVQYFAGYSAWVRSRSGGQRSWWSPRGWFIPGFSWIEDDEYPEIKTAQFAILDSIAAAIMSHPEVVDMNSSLYGRYQKYGKQDVESFREYFHNGILVNLALRGREVSGSGVTNPRITYFSVTTEAPDETARGDWLKLVCTAGLAHSTALLRYLNDGVNEINRDTEQFENCVTRSVYRTKPVSPQSHSLEPPGKSMASLKGASLPSTSR